MPDRTMNMPIILGAAASFWSDDDQPPARGIGVQTITTEEGRGIGLLAMAGDSGTLVRLDLEAATVLAERLCRLIAAETAAARSLENITRTLEGLTHD